MDDKKKRKTLCKNYLFGLNHRFNQRLIRMEFDLFALSFLSLVFRRNKQQKKCLDYASFTQKTYLFRRKIQSYLKKNKHISFSFIIERDASFSYCYFVTERKKEREKKTRVPINSLLILFSITQSSSFFPSILSQRVFLTSNICY